MVKWTSETKQVQYFSRSYNDENFAATYGNEPLLQISAGLLHHYFCLPFCFVCLQWIVADLFFQLAQCSNNKTRWDQFHKLVLHSKTSLFCITTVIAAAYAEEESDSNFCKTCQAMKG